MLLLLRSCCCVAMHFKQPSHTVARTVHLYIFSIYITYYRERVCCDRILDRNKQQHRQKSFLPNFFRSGVMVVA